MSASVLIKGPLFRAPESKTSSGGKSYVRAAIKVQSATDNGVDWWSVMALGETARAALADLQDGDHLAVQGAMKLEIYNGKVQRTVFADQVLPLRTRKPRKDKPVATNNTTGTSKQPPFDDPINF
jgi:single-stranded DNA-binding protein